MFVCQRDNYKGTMEQLKLENNAKWKLQERDDWRALVESLTRDRDRLKGELSDAEGRLSAVSAELEDLKCANSSRSDNDTDSEVLSNPDSPPESPRDSPIRDEVRRNTANNRNIVVHGSQSVEDKSLEQLYKDLQHEYGELQQQEKFHRLEAMSLREQYAKIREENHHLRYNVHHGLQPGTYSNTAERNDQHKNSNNCISLDQPSQEHGNNAMNTTASRGWFGFSSVAQKPSKKTNSNIILHV